MDVSKNRGFSPPKWMVKIRENPINPNGMIWGYHLFLETPICGGTTYFWKHLFDIFDRTLYIFQFQFVMILILPCHSFPCHLLAHCFRYCCWTGSLSHNILGFHVVQDFGHQQYEATKFNMIQGDPNTLPGWFCSAQPLGASTSNLT